MVPAQSLQPGNPAAFSVTPPPQAAIGGGIPLPVSHAMPAPQTFGGQDAYFGNAAAKPGSAQPKFGFYIPVACEIALGCCAVGCAVPALLIGGLVFGGKAIFNLVTWPLRAIGGLVTGGGKKTKAEPAEE